MEPETRPTSRACRLTDPFDIEPAYGKKIDVAGPEHNGGAKVLARSVAIAVGELMVGAAQHSADLVEVHARVDHERRRRVPQQVGLYALLQPAAFCPR